jgi:hypothetical protein
MASVNKILNKINKAKSAINSFKGISSKLKSLNFTSALDKLGEQAEESKRVLEQRRSSLKKGLEAANGSAAKAKKTPNGGDVELIYPINDLLENYIVFSCLKREDKTEIGGTDDNFFQESSIDIMLYVPDGISSAMSVDYESKGKSALGITANAAIESLLSGGSAMDALNAGGTAAKGVANKFFGEFANTLSGDQFNRKRNLAVNPMKEQFFNGVNYRSFEFVYEFWPKSQDEADMVNEIIYTFRSAMLPSTTSPMFDKDGQLENYFNYPNKFTAEFEGPIAKTLDGYLEMVCTKCDVDHFNGQKFAVFEGGQPISTKMTIGFTEMKIMSQQNYHEISAFKKAEKAHGDEIRRQLAISVPNALGIDNGDG